MIPRPNRKFIGDGNGIDRRQIAWNDFIFLGPQSDPAHIVGTHDAVAALKAIAAAKTSFVSRGDRSGTNAIELRLWKVADIDPKTGGVGRYRNIGGGMGQALNTAAAMPAYTPSDRGTWLSFQNKQALIVTVEGDPYLVNRYDVIELNPSKHPTPNLLPLVAPRTGWSRPTGKRRSGPIRWAISSFSTPRPTHPK